MRRQRFLRASSAQSICIFCSTRFQPAYHASPIALRRCLNTHRPVNQSAATAQAPEKDAPINSDAAAAKSQLTWGHNSTLTATEQREKENRRQQRVAAEVEQEKRRIADLERRHAEEKAKRGALEEQRRTQQAEMVKQRIESRTQQSEIDKQRLERRRVHMEAERKKHALDKEQRSIEARTADLEARAAAAARGRELANERRMREESKSVFNNAKMSRQPKRAQSTPMPAFGLSMVPPESSTGGTGWGSAADDVKPLEYGDAGEGQQQAAPQLSIRRRSSDSTLVSQERQQRRTPQQPRIRQIQMNDTRPVEKRLRSQNDQPQFQFDGNKSDDAAWNYSDNDNFQADHDGAEKVPIAQNSDAPSDAFMPFEKYNAAPSNQGYDDFGAASRGPPTYPTHSYDRQHQPRHETQSSRGSRPRSVNSQIHRDYDTTPFDPSQYLPQSQFDESQADSWQHLSRRRTQSDPPAPPPPVPVAEQQQPQVRSSPFDDPDEVERNFRAHQQQRRIPRARSENYVDSGAFPPQARNAEPSRSQGRRCARCLEFGHAAKDCTGPVRRKCHVCGEEGHIAPQCPSRNAKHRTPRQDSTGNSFVKKLKSTDPEGEEHAQRKAEGSLNIRRVDSSGRESAPLFDRSAPFQDARAQEEPKAMAQSSPSTWQNDQVSQSDRGREWWREPSEHTSQSRPEVQRHAPEKDEDSATSRRSRRSARGFEDEPEEVAAQPERRQRRQGRRSMETQIEEMDEEAAVLREERLARKAERRAARQAALAEQRAVVHLPEFISVQNLAQTLGVHYETFVKRLERLGYDDLFPGKVLNTETSGMIAMEYDLDPVFEDAAKDLDAERDLKPQPETEDMEILPTRPPVVTIMGHVDHGKTTILDYLRKSAVAAGEAGGITQHIGAFSVPLSAAEGEENQGKTITFLDTPGHAAFLSMRQRGANVTDIVVLVVAADDSVKPQTLESLRCAKEAKVPVLVAINKIDKEGADVQRVKQDLAQHGVEIEDFGGDVQTVEVSGKTGQGIESLQEAIVTLGDVLDHRADVEGAVEGWVLEATTSKAAGRVATVLVKRGTLNSGDVLVAGTTWARVKTLKNERGEVVDSVLPGAPVEVDGWREQPSAGDQVLQALAGEQKAANIVEYRKEKAEREKMEADIEAINEARRAEQQKRAQTAKNFRFAGYGDLLEDLTGGESATTAPDATATPAEDEPAGQITVPFLIKADVSGSAEALAAYIPSLTSPLIAPNILSSSVGAVNPSDIDLASAAGGHIIAFSLPADEGTKAAARKRGVNILENDVIYRVLDDVKAVLEERLPPLITQRVLGECEIGAAFEIGVGGRKKIKIAGCKVRNGVVGVKGRCRVLRGNGGEKVYDGVITSLKNVKKDVQEMRKGTECGVGFEGWDGFEVGDVVQCYEEVSEKRKL